MRRLPLNWESKFDPDTLRLARRIVRKVGFDSSAFEVFDVALMLQRHAAKRARTP